MTEEYHVYAYNPADMANGWTKYIVPEHQFRNYPTEKLIRLTASEEGSLVYMDIPFDRIIRIEKHSV